MALSQSDVSELLDAIRAGGDIDVIRKGVELVLQALIEAEATEVIALAMSVGEVHRQPQATMAQAGWYPDPYGPGQRWWNGTSWTDVTR